MSLGYAEKLTFRPPEELGGKLGGREKEDDEKELNAKVHQLIEWLRSVEREGERGGGEREGEELRGVTVFTGAGISTSSGIPDFRGPRGIWTLQSQGQPTPKLDTEFGLVSPSYTHMALVALIQHGIVRLVCSQNVDGIHLRSGIAPDRLAELHGNCFIEKVGERWLRFPPLHSALTRTPATQCDRCRATFRRDFEMDCVGFRTTGRRCAISGCRGRLRDVVLDWEDALPEDDVAKSEHCARTSSLALCLGTSLRIAPACQLPLLTPEAGGRLVIVNLQKVSGCERFVSLNRSIH